MFKNQYVKHSGFALLNLIWICPMFPLLNQLLQTNILPHFPFPMERELLLKLPCFRTSTIFRPLQFYYHFGSLVLLWKSSFGHLKLVLQSRSYDWPARYPERLRNFAGTIFRSFWGVYTNSFLPNTIWNLVPTHCFALAYDLSHINSRLNKHLVSINCV